MPASARGTYPPSARGLEDTPRSPTCAVPILRAELTERIRKLDLRIAGTPHEERARRLFRRMDELRQRIDYRQPGWEDPSGGITEETTVLGVPCLTLRDNTERPETVTIGTNELTGTDPRKLPPALQRLMAGQWKKGAIPPLWDGNTAVRIVEHLETLLAQQ